MMRDDYDSSKMKARRNSYVRSLKQSVTIRLDREIVAYFKELAAKTGLPYQHLINLYLRDCALRRKEPSLKWSSAAHRTAGGSAARRKE
jgi:predicted DNA binding CopG/RHH family protein